MLYCDYLKYYLETLTFQNKSWRIYNLLIWAIISSDYRVSSVQHQTMLPSHCFPSEAGLTSLKRSSSWWHVYLYLWHQMFSWLPSLFTVCVWWAASCPGTGAQNLQYRCSRFIVKTLRPSYANMRHYKLSHHWFRWWLAPERRQTIIWTNDRILLIKPWGTNFNEIFIKI